VGASLAPALLILAASLTVKGAELSPDTLKAWDTYVQEQNARVAGYSKAIRFVWSDQSPDRMRDLHRISKAGMPGASLLSAPVRGYQHDRERQVMRWSERLQLRLYRTELSR
jgi:hypothetical protein